MCKKCFLKIYFGIQSAQTSDEELIAKSPVAVMSTDSIQSETNEADTQVQIGDFEAYLNSVQENTAEPSNVVASQFLLTQLMMRWAK